ncbi:MAG: hypothetical protein HYV07_22965 [Deltaproteobacteria bacterium]|nr:hypothetical protein [Deltaproteobacteria bacterium]
MSGRGAARCLCVIMMCNPAPSLASTPVMRLGLISEHVDPASANQLSLELVEASVLEALDFVLGLRAERIAASTVQRCGSEVPCVASAMRKAGLDLVLRVTMNGALDPPLLSLRLHRAGAEQPATQLVDLRPLGDATPAEIAKEARRVVLASGFELGGKLEVQATPADAFVSLPGLPPARAGVTPALPAGVRRLSITRSGFDDAQLEAVVVAGETQLVQATLSPEFRLFESPWVWVGGSALAVGAVAVVLAIALPQRVPATLCQASSSARCEKR